MPFANFRNRVLAALYDRPQVPAEQQGEPGDPPGDRKIPPRLESLLNSFPWLRRHPHPMLSHFPIVFMLSASFFSVLYVVTGDQSFEDTAFYCLGGGLLTMPPAVASGLFTHWLNFPGELHQTVDIEIGLSYAVMTIAGVCFFWRWHNPPVLEDLNGINLLYFILVLSLTPLVIANGYFGGMVTFPLEEEAPTPPRT